MRFYGNGLGCIDHLSASCILPISTWHFLLYSLRGHSFDNLDVKDVGYVIVSGHLQLFDHWADDMVSELRLPK